MGLAWRYWSLMNSSACPTLPSDLDGLLAARHRDGIEQHRRHRLERDLDLQGVALLGLHRAQPRPDVARHGALLAAARRAARRAASPSTPSATRMAMRRVANAAVAGRANSDSAGETLDLGLRRASSAPSAAGAGISMPSSAGQRLGQPGVHVGQHRDHALADGRHLHLGQLEAEARAGCAPSRPASGCCRTAWPACSARRTSPACRAPCRPRWARGTR